MRRTKADGIEMPMAPEFEEVPKAESYTYGRIHKEDVQAIADAVYEKLKNDNSNIDNPKSTITLEQLDGFNKDLYRRLARPWNEHFASVMTVIMQLFGLEFSKDEDGTLRISPIYPLLQGIFESKAKSSPKSTFSKWSKRILSETIRKKLHNGWQRVWADVTSCFWKSFAYYVAALGFGFGLIQWWVCSRTTDRVTTELNIIRMVVGSDSGGKQLLNSIDSDIRNYGLDDTYSSINRAVEERKNKDNHK